ncbi:MAG: dihydroorotase [Kiritimatiellia bacterium]
MSKFLEFPGFVDVHVHFRDPGMPSAETTASGLQAARRGGFAAVVTMPNTLPACDSPAVIRHQLAAARAADDSTALLPSACLTRGRLGREVADLESLAAAGAAFFTDDGSYVEEDRVMEEAMRRARGLQMVVCQHAMTWKGGGSPAGNVIRDCALARRLGLGLIPASVETDAIRRDLALCRETGCRLHIQHISTAGGVALVRAAQQEGLPVTAEATPHHLLLSCEDLTADDANFKMAPPLGNHEDRAELRKAVKEGVLMFATDHAPHPASVKSGGFATSANGIIGLETAIPITYQVMVEEEGMAVEDWARAWYELPRRILAPGAARPEQWRKTVVEIGAARPVDLSTFASRARNCPYDGLSFTCWPVPS